MFVTQELLTRELRNIERDLRLSYGRWLKTECECQPQYNKHLHSGDSERSVWHQFATRVAPQATLAAAMIVEA
jgi:hypothetical protein